MSAPVPRMVDVSGLIDAVTAVEAEMDALTADCRELAAKQGRAAESLVSAAPRAGTARPDAGKPRSTVVDTAQPLWFDQSMTAQTLTRTAPAVSRTVWTLQGGPTEPEPFLNRHPVLFVVWAVWHRIKFLRTLGV